MEFSMNYKSFDYFLSHQMNRVPLAVFIIEDDRNNAINTGEKCDLPVGLIW